MLDDVAYVETVARPAARSPNAKAAINYLVASGATAISVIETGTGCTFRVGTKIDPHAVEIYWLTAAQAKPLVRLARKQAGRHPNTATASATLARAAAALRVLLTPHNAAMTRAGDAAARLNNFMDSLRGTGRLKEFNRMFKSRRMEATLNGQGFMTYAVAEARLRKALIPYLIGGRTIGPVQTLFEQIFDR
jgi:hypothetical protein